MALRSLVIPAGEVSDSQFATMLQIMRSYYLNVDDKQFRADLQEKDLVIILREGEVIHGFSTWLLLEHEIRGETVGIIFSGDTIIEKEYWHSMALPLAWGRLMLSTLERNPGRRLYWLLTSKGYKTYRFLPVFFGEFYPTWVRQTPEFEKALLDSFAARKFGSRYNPLTGIISAPEGAQKLAPGVADIGDSRRKDRHIAFFEAANPGYANGDELVCLVRCCTDNISAFIRRYLGV